MAFSCSFSKLIGAFLVCGALSTANATTATLLEKLPSINLEGVQSDPGTSPWSETLSITGPVAISKISWWGYYLEDTKDAEGGDYQFSVKLGDSGILPGTVSRSFDSIISDAQDPQFTQDLYRYELNVTDVSFMGGATTLEVFNNSEDVVWLWQGANGDRAFHLEGSIIPEPEIYVMLLAGLGVMGVAARRRRHKVS